MKVKMSYFERVAGLFVLTAFVGSLVVSLGLALKKGWFSPKSHYVLVTTSAEGLRPGTAVQISGLRAGQVTEIDLISGHEVHVHFFVFSRFENQLRKDSLVSVIRPFVIGEKVIDIGVGSADQPPISPGAQLQAELGFDLMDIFSGRRLAPFLGTLERLSENLVVVAESFADPKRTEALIKMFDTMEPLIRNLNEMSIEMLKATKTVNQQQRLEKTLENMILLTGEMNKILPEFNKELPDIGPQLAQIVRNLSVLTEEFQKLTPVLTSVAPAIPGASQRAVEALDETVITLKALQRTFLLRSSVREVLKEEEEQREPASQD